MRREVHSRAYGARREQCEVLTFDARRGRVVVVAEDGARHVVPWGVASGAGVLAVGQRVEVTFVNDGEVAELRAEP